MADGKVKPEDSKRKGKKERQKNKLRENIESILIAVALAFCIRYFVVEAFKIPTGSMAPTLLGAHKNVLCPNCGWEFKSDHNSDTAICPNCIYEIDISRYCMECRREFHFSKPESLRKSGTCPQCKNELAKEDASNRVRYGGNRIAVSKLSYKFSDPKRWDVIVFIYPLYDAVCKNCSTLYNDVRLDDGFACKKCGSERFSKKKKNYIKRLIGLPGEKLQIINGDIYINGKIEQKPDKIQKELWLPVYDSAFPPRKEVIPAWIAKDNYWKITETNLLLTMKGTKGKSSFVKFGRKIIDRNAYNDQNVPFTETGDMMMEFDFEASNESNGGIHIVIEEDDKEFDAFLALRGNANDESHMSVTEYSNTDDSITEQVVAKSSNIILESGKRYHIEFSNVDNLVKLLLDGIEVLSYSYDLDKTPERVFSHKSGLKLGGIDVDGVIDNLKIKRDIYYSPLNNANFAVNAPAQLGENDLFAMGDNSRNSNDSRVWGYVPKKNLVGKAFFVWWPLSTIKVIR